MTFVVYLLSKSIAHAYLHTNFFLASMYKHFVRCYMIELVSVKAVDSFKTTRSEIANIIAGIQIIWPVWWFPYCHVAVGIIVNETWFWECCTRTGNRQTSVSTGLLGVKTAQGNTCTPATLLMVWVGQKELGQH
jgi:hypothetical protein